jgi:hypothetical protein
MAKQTNIHRIFKKHQKIITRVVVFLLLYIVSMFLPIIGGYTAYPVAIARCGKLPVITSDFMAGYDYSEPGMTSYYGPSWLNTNKNYVCTAQDAEAEGYRKAPW